MVALPCGHCSRWTVKFDPNSISSMNSNGGSVLSGKELVNSLNVGLSGLALRDKVFLKDVRWQERASGMRGGVFRAKCLVAHTRAVAHDCGRLENGSTFDSSFKRGKSLAFRVGVGEVSSASRTSISEMRTLNSTLYGRQQRRDTRIRGAEDDFEVEDAVDYEMDGAGEDDEDEGDLRDYDTEYDMPMGEYTVQESETFMSTEGVEEERVVDYKIDEDEFHKISLFDCDFFIRKIPDQDNDVFDFREMYVTAPDTDTYAIPKVIGEMPKKPLRCMKSNYEYISVTEPPVDTPRAPLSKTEYQAMKVFLIKHYRNLREDHEDFVLDFENIYVIDSATKSITKADVKVEVRRGKYRDRSAETLIVRDDGTTFKIIPSEDVHNPDEVIQALQWDRTKENMDNYLRGFRDYEKSKWF